MAPWMAKNKDPEPVSLRCAVHVSARRPYGADTPTWWKTACSVDLELRRDGLPYANQREPTDKGVAVYFEWKGQPRVFACDRWDRIKDNIRAQEKTIEAIRGIERWGASDMLERAFTGFTALPAPGAKRSWREVLGFDRTSNPDREGIELAFRSKAKRAHPDAGGSTEAMAELNAARAEALQEVSR